MWKNLLKKKTEDTGKVLAENPVFKSLRKKELKLLVNLVHHRSFVPGEFVTRPGKGTGMYIVLSGKIHILWEAQEATKPVVMCQLGEKEFFGEVSLVQESGYKYFSAQAVEECRLLGFFKPDLFTLVEKHPSIGAKVLLALSQILSERLQRAGDKLAQFNQKLEN